MKINFGSTVRGLTLDGMTGMGGQASGGARDFTIKNCVFTDSIDIDATNANIVLDHNSHDWMAVYNVNGGTNVIVWNNTGAFSGVTVKNSTLRNGNLDGIHLGAGIDILDKIFDNLCDTQTNHTDNIQYEGGTGGHIAGNYIHSSSNCETQAITSFDSGTNGVIIEDNVIDTSRGYGIEFYSDKNSIIRHNTLIYRASGCATKVCGIIDISRKTADPAGVGTQVYDNIVTDVSFENGSGGTSTHNMFHWCWARTSTACRYMSAAQLRRPSKAQSLRLAHPAKVQPLTTPIWARASSLPGYSVINRRSSSAPRAERGAGGVDRICARGFYFRGRCARGGRLGSQFQQLALGQFAFALELVVHFDSPGRSLCAWQPRRRALQTAHAVLGLLQLELQPLLARVNLA